MIARNNVTAARPIALRHSPLNLWSVALAHLAARPLVQGVRWLATSA